MESEQQKDIDVNGPLEEFILVNGKPEKFNLFRVDFTNEIADMISQENIPYKIIQALESAGIKVERVPIWASRTEINKKQIDAKMRLGHLQ